MSVEGWGLIDWSLIDWSLDGEVPVTGVLGCSTMDLDAASTSLTLEAASVSMAIETCQ